MAYHTLQAYGIIVLSGAMFVASIAELQRWTSRVPQMVHFAVWLFNGLWFWQMSLARYMYPHGKGLHDSAWAYLLKLRRIKNPNDNYEVDANEIILVYLGLCMWMTAAAVCAQLQFGSRRLGQGSQLQQSIDSIGAVADRRRLVGHSAELGAGMCDDDEV